MVVFFLIATKGRLQSFKYYCKNLADDKEDYDEEALMKEIHDKGYNSFFGINGTK